MHSVLNRLWLLFPNSDDSTSDYDEESDENEWDSLLSSLPDKQVRDEKVHLERYYEQFMDHYSKARPQGVSTMCKSIYIYPEGRGQMVTTDTFIVETALHNMYGLLLSNVTKTFFAIEKSDVVIYTKATSAFAQKWIEKCKEMSQRHNIHFDGHDLDVRLVGFLCGPLKDWPVTILEVNQIEIFDLWLLLPKYSLLV